MIPITTVQFGADEEALVLEVQRSGSMDQGPKGAQLETTFARQADSRPLSPSTTGDGVDRRVQVLDVQPGDEVIATPYRIAQDLALALDLAFRGGWPDGWRHRPLAVPRRNGDAPYSNTTG